MKTYKIQYYNKQQKLFNEYEITTDEKIQTSDIAKMWKVEKAANKNLGEILILDENDKLIAFYN